MKITRAAFAALTSVSRQTVGGWIRDGHLTPPATIGEGRGLRIDPALAKGQLAGRLDASKRSPIDDEDRELVRLLRAERLRQAKITTERMLREDEEAQPDRRLLTREQMDAVSWANQQMFKSMIQSACAVVANQTVADVQGLDARLLRHRFRVAFDEEWRRWGASPERAEAARRIIREMASTA
jgi:hypothetical protein